jgi:hypothetical protein
LLDQDPHAMHAFLRHGQASRRVTAIRGDVRPELNVPGAWPSRALPEGHFRGEDASVFSPFFWIGGEMRSRLSALVAVAAPTSNVMQRAKMESRGGRREVYAGCRTVGRAAPGCNHYQRGW